MILLKKKRGLYECIYNIIYNILFRDRGLIALSPDVFSEALKVFTCPQRPLLYFGLKLHSPGKVEVEGSRRRRGV